MAVLYSEAYSWLCCSAIAFNFDVRLLVLAATVALALALAWFLIALRASSWNWIERNPIKAMKNNARQVGWEIYDTVFESALSHDRSRGAGDS
jgi:hypothetical protein